ncbi:MAG: DNA mismatch repair endonuclease MutL [Oscillospiraceae bacterium]|nr:DNA mismatch repair endonuclease MutL [Oscillospiraceae bacterium]
MSSIPIINILSPHVADLIAAGEVVERPASAVKELVENAIDAHARNITVEIRAGGMKAIRVTDDGCGMSPEDAGIAFLRHATSKLHDADGLSCIATLGFRGEALAAIAAVSHITLLTRAKGESTGTRLRLCAGEIEEMTPAGCPEGTSISVEDLFYNTPARLKFMKSDRAEGSACAAAALRCALGHPEVSVRFSKDGVEQFFSPGDGQARSAVYALLGRDAAMGLLPCAGEADGVSVAGFVSAPHASRGNRAMQFFFLNGRAFRSAALQAALEQAYRNTLLTGRFPACVLYLTLAPGKADVNVHPTKSEVKFSEEKKVFDAVYCAVRAALEERETQSTAEICLSPGTRRAAAAPRRDFYQTMSAAAFRERTGQAEPQTARAPAPSAPEQTRMTLHQEAVPYGTSRTVPRPELPQTRPAAPQMQAEPDEKAAASGVPSAQAEPEAAPAPAAPEDYRVIGEAMNTYIIVETGDALLLIDKHACHERIIFDRVSAGLGAQMCQTLLVPVTYSPGAGAVELLERNLPLLEEAGFVLERFGEDGVIIRAVPADTDGSEIAMLEVILNTLQTGRGGDPRETVCHTIACKAAIKAGSRSDPAELDALAARVVSGEIRYCPHGRPVAVRLTRRELDKQFKRIV